MLWLSCGFTLNARLHNGMGDKTVNLCALLISVGNHSSFFEIVLDKVMIDIQPLVLAGKNNCGMNVHLQI